MSASVPAAPTESEIITDVVCAGCGCLCDDIEVTRQGNAITALENVCPKGDAWFHAPRFAEDAPCRIEGRPTTMEAAIARAAKLLEGAKFPLVYGMAEADIDAQRAAVELADRIGGAIDLADFGGHAAGVLAMQEVGEVTCSLGEVKGRADLVVIWGANPLETHPRLYSRYAVDPTGRWIMSGRSDRTVIAVDSRSTRTTADADRFIPIPPESDFEALWILRAMVKGVELDAAAAARTGLDLVALADLAERMKRARFGVVFFGAGLAESRGEHRNIEAMLRLVRDLNAFACFAVRPLGAPGNTAGAENVLAWQTGFPFAISLAHGAPKHNEREFAATPLLEKGEVDAAVILAADPLVEMAPAAARYLRTIPTIALDVRETETFRSATVAIPIAQYGIHVAGGAHRMDDVPLPLRPVLSSKLPAAEKVLKTLIAAFAR
ncbi:MAG TPA: formylmethanofuran dehydrogenase subunit B [Planctomycetia bacterium]|nr:formylmethanofuran dehydrogenase subunit B [Planctomycetia bacterium]